MKRIITALLCAAMLFVSPATVIFADTSAPETAPAGNDGGIPEVSSSTPPEAEKCRSAYLYCFENSRSLYDYNADETVYPTSTVKIMTGIVAMEHYAGKLDTEITVTAGMLAEVTGNKLSPALTAGEVVTVRDMLYGCLVGGANDAAYVLAHAVAGSAEEFVTLMNTKAGSTAIGARNTKYTNPTGMHDDGMFTTARDTAQIAIYAWDIPEFAEIVSTSKYVMEETNKNEFRTIYNRNSTISKYYAAGYYDERALGMNAGGTPVGGYCTVQVMRDADTGVTFLCVVMGADWEDEGGAIYSYENAKSLMDWAFGAYTYVEVLSSELIVYEMPVTLSSTVDYVTLQPAQSVVVFLPTDVDVENEVQVHFTTLTESLAAPVLEGQVVGNVTVTYGDEILGTVDLLTTADVTRSEFLHLLAQIEDFTKSKFFIATAVSAVVLSAVYVFAGAFLRKRRARRL